MVLKLGVNLKSYRVFVIDLGMWCEVLIYLRKRGRAVASSGLKQYEIHVGTTGTV